jgi:hypothetical protein
MRPSFPRPIRQRQGFRLRRPPVEGLQSAIYDATAPCHQPRALKDTVVTETRQLAVSGKIAQATAKSSAQAAGQCLELLAGN